MKLGLVWLALVACSDRTPDDTVTIRDGGPLFPGDVCSCAGCSVLTQQGCSNGEKCTWVLVTDATPDAPGLGSNTCAPDGTIALGGTCTTRVVARGGYDDCVAGTICVAGTCAQVCNSSFGEAPGCPAGDACQTHDGLFANAGSTTTPAGACAPAGAP